MIRQKILAVALICLYIVLALILLGCQEKNNLQIQQRKNQMIHSFYITPDGMSRSVYADSLITFYEQLEHDRIRASNVEFDKDLRLWVAIDAETGETITMQKMRSQAIAIEIEYLNKKFETGYPANIEIV